VDWRVGRQTFGIAALAAAFAILPAACQDPDAYYRNVPVMVGDGGVDHAPAQGTAGTGAAGTGAAGSSPFAGVAGTSGAAGTSAAGTSGGAGTTAAAGTGGGAGTSGAAGTGGGTCVGCRVSVVYTCLSDASDQASFVVEAQNKSGFAILLGDLTLRYWFTADGKEPELHCDVAKLNCSKISTSQSQPPVKFQSVVPPRPKADTYVEIKFPAGALDVNGTTGNVQLRLNNKDHSPMNQADDYSVDCGSKNTPHDAGKITAYLKGVLVGGTEP
jgi:hypothetical protein